MAMPHTPRPPGPLRPRPLVGLTPALALALALAAQAPARAGLLRPLLDLMRPQLEQRLTRICVEAVADRQPALADQLERPCQQLAASTSRCLVKETDASGKGLALLGELLQKELGPEGERIVKRCVARQLGLPAGSLEGIPLRQLTQRFSDRRL
jgi:hypothetical protein